jgi:hypothetical protein
MSVTPAPDMLAAPGVNNVANDFTTAFVGNPYMYSTAMNQQAAMQVPLGSQLALLTAANMGNNYVNGVRLDNVRLGSLANVLTGYNTLSMAPSLGGYYNFSTAYGKW